MPHSLSQLLKELRLQGGLTQRMLADRAGLSIRTIGASESGHAPPTADSVSRILKAIGASHSEVETAFRLVNCPEHVTPEVTLDNSLVEAIWGPLPGVANILTLLRLRRGWTQSELAEALSVTRFTVNRWESSTHVPSDDLLLQIGSCLDASQSEINAMKGISLRSKGVSCNWTAEECIEATGLFEAATSLYDSPHIDLQFVFLCLSIRRTLAWSPLLVELLVRADTDYGMWLLFHNRIPESRIATRRAIRMSEKMPDLPMPAKLVNLSASLESVNNGNYRGAIRLLRKRIPQMGDSSTTNWLYCDIALYESMSGNAEGCDYWLDLATRGLHKSNDAELDRYVQTTRNRIQLRTRRSGEALAKLLELPATGHQRTIHLLMWAADLRYGGELSMSRKLLEAVEPRMTASTPPRVQKLFDKLAQEF